MVRRGNRWPTWHRPKNLHPGALKHGQGNTEKCFVYARKVKSIVVRVYSMASVSCYLNKLQHNQMYLCSKHHSRTHWFVF